MTPPPRAPTPDQQAVLESAARIRVVRAAPGSGKTWLVAEAIRGELASWSTPAAGIAALSFTRVGGDEIRHALGRDLEHPHFVGTLDSFLFRYIVRPHLRAIAPDLPSPILVPGEWEPDKNWRRVEVAKTDDPSVKINPFACVWIGRDANREPVIARPLRNSGKFETLSSEDRDRVMQVKRDLWRSRGLVTHSDAAYLAAKILRHRDRGPSVRQALIRRYPFIVVDELQDTGHFLSESIYALLTTPESRGLLVGDPDQAIYEFTGARPKLFDGFRHLTQRTVS
jgi:DNA helicase-2/ATP-dependent DNA helicase PcrA